jgi:hypothetical protein
VTGRIVTETGLAIHQLLSSQGPGFSSTSNENRDYEISAPMESGFLMSDLPPPIKINGRTTIDVSLSSIPNSLSQVIVVGYGTQKEVM